MAFSSSEIADNEYRCGACGLTFEFIRDETWSDVAAVAEFRATFGDVALEEPSVVVCDDCYEKVMKARA